MFDKFNKNWDKKKKNGSLKVKRFLKKISNYPEGLGLTIIVLFTAFNWVLLSTAEKLGPPDVYKLYEVAQKLFSGDLKIGIIPPLFPLLQFPLSKGINLFTQNPMEAFILAGRCLSLVAGIGVLLFSYLILKKFIGRHALIGVLLLTLFPWYLKLLAFPITDMLYLFFISMAFYYFLKPGKKAIMAALTAVCGGVLTRFEGVLLFLSTLLNYFKCKKKHVYMLLASLPVLAAVLYFFFKFNTRFYAHFRDIILPQKSYLFMFQHPLDFLNMIYGNIFFFIPFSYPYIIKLALLIMALTFFLYGAYRLLQIERSFALALLVYEFLFMAAKGYVNTAIPEIEFRRVVSGLWIFYLLCFMGACWLLQKIKSPKIKILFYTLISSLIIALLLSCPRVSFPGYLVAVPVLLVLGFIWLNTPTAWKIKIPALIVILLFLVPVFHFSFMQTQDYVTSMAPKVPYAAAQWLNSTPLKQGTVILSYTDNLMMRFYLKDDKLAAIRWETFTVPLIISEETKEQYIKAFFKEIRDRQVDYVITDNYVVPEPEFLNINQAKRMLYEEKENKTYFRVKKYLFYKGQNVGYVLKPADAQTNH